MEGTRMNVSATDLDVQVQKFNAAAARSEGFLALPLKAIRDLGQSAQSLSGILAVLRQDGRTTARHQKHLAAAALVPLRTFQRHLSDLEAANLVKVTREPNQTAITAAVIDEADVMSEGFLPLPRYAEKLPWSERLVYAVLIYRAELSIGGDTVEDSAARIGRMVGITRRSVTNAINGLVCRGWIARSADLPGEKGTFRLLPPGSTPTPGSGCEKVAAPHQTGWEKVAAGGGKKWRQGREKVAAPSFKNLSKKLIREKHTDHICYQVGEIERIAADLFRRSGYSGDDGSLFWKLAAMVAAGLVSQFEVHDATNGARECSADNRPAYAAAIMKKHLERRGASLSDLMRRVRIEPHLPAKRPETRNLGPVDLANLIKRA